MEYIYFFAFSAVIGIAVMLFAHISTNRKSARASGAWVDDTPIPPRKRTISGKTETEMDVVQLQDRIVRWQRANAGRWHNFQQSAEALRGEKYEYQPHVPRDIRQRPAGALSTPKSRRFELL